MTLCRQRYGTTYMIFASYAMFPVTRCSNWRRRLHRHAGGGERGEGSAKAGSVGLVTSRKTPYKRDVDNVIRTIGKKRSVCARSKRTTPSMPPFRTSLPRVFPAFFLRRNDFQCTPSIADPLPHSTSSSLLRSTPFPPHTYPFIHEHPIPPFALQPSLPL